jgi:hypothetical protein
MMDAIAEARLNLDSELDPIRCGWLLEAGLADDIMAAADRYALAVLDEATAIVQLCVGRGPGSLATYELLAYLRARLTETVAQPSSREACSSDQESG